MCCSCMCRCVRLHYKVLLMSDEVLDVSPALGHIHRCITSVISYKCHTNYYCCRHKTDKYHLLSSLTSATQTTIVACITSYLLQVPHKLLLLHAYNWQVSHLISCKCHTNYYCCMHTTDKYQMLSLTSATQTIIVACIQLTNIPSKLCKGYQ